MGPLCRIAVTIFALAYTHSANKSASKARESALGFTGTLRVTADNLDAVGVHLIRVVELEVDVLDDECPDIVAETVGIEVALRACQ